MNDEKGSRACELAVKLARRVMQHAYAEPKYLGNLLYRGFEETVLLIKIVSIQKYKFNILFLIFIKSEKNRFLRIFQLSKKKKKSFASISVIYIF